MGGETKGEVDGKIAGIDTTRMAAKHIRELLLDTIQKQAAEPHRSSQQDAVLEGVVHDLRSAGSRFTEQELLTEWHELFSVSNAPSSNRTGPFRSSGFQTVFTGPCTCFRRWGGANRTALGTTSI
jgi:hypothetical protein